MNQKVRDNGMCEQVVREDSASDRRLGDLAAEWQRIELLGHCMSQSRHGRAIEDEVLDRLRDLQQQVEKIRNGHGPWQRLMAQPLEPLEYDVLACVVAPEAEPRLAWMYQSLQPGTPQPYPTPALMQELLALDPAGVDAMFAALAEQSSLQRMRLIEVSDPHTFEPVRPGAGVVARLLNRQWSEPAPPGATRVTERAAWDDLVLPPNRIKMLREFLHWVQYRPKVVNEWQGVDCGGPVALFAGASGTGKTFAAAVLAGALDWPLYRVDLATLISKYIGETEKNLNRLFDAAHDRRVVLQFDEADSVFGKRGEIKEARDRYANMEVSHLLARVEAHRGPCILTTNLRGHLDPAFARRFQVVVDFPRPDETARTGLWRRLLPPRAPLEADVDVAFLGAAVNLTGGGIRNAALHAAYLAAADQRPISLRHIALSVWRELGKDGREISPNSLGALAEFLEFHESP